MNPRKTAPPTPHAQALALGFSPVTAQRCADLVGMGWSDPQDAAQPETDFFVAYAAAKARAKDFQKEVEGFGTRLHVEATTRPGNVKSLERIVEKYTTSLILPLDLLGAKIIVNSLGKLYEVADSVAGHFDVVAYKDRILSPQKSGYRDVQFIVAVRGQGQPHYAELKIMHVLYDELDAYEHRLYEIRRGLEARQRERRATLSADIQRGPQRFGADLLTPVERLVYTQLNASSQELFAETWALVQAQQSGQEPQ